MADNETQFTQFLESLGAFESGIDTSKQYGSNDLDWLMVFDPSKGNVDRSSVDLNNPDDLAMLQYHVHNTLGFLGKYQFGEPLLIDLGYYNPAPTGFYGTTATNEWQGTWTGKNGVYSKEDFMSEVQELAIREAFAMNMGVIETRLSQAGHTLDDFMGQEFTYTRFGIQETAVVTMSGILASAHLQGPGGVANLLLNGVASSDEYGTNILFYMDEFGGFDTPFGTAADDTLSGSDYTETFDGGTGDNVYTTGDGYDQVIISENPNATDTITDFDVTNDVISLAALGLAYDDLTLSQANGNTIIELPNNQSIVLNGVAATDVTAANFVQGPIVMSWNANSGDTVIENFNLRHDLIDLNYAFGNDNLAIYEENGSSVIEVVGNNQRLILKDVALDDLNAFNFVKAPIGFGDVFFSDGADNSPPPATDPPVDDTPPVDSTPPQDDTPPVSANDGTYSFTWNWGSEAHIADFDPATESINLQSFWTSYDAFEIYAQEGNTVLDLTNLNNQTIVIENILPSELSASNFLGVTGTYPLAANDNTPDPDPVPDPEPEPDPEPSDPPVDTGDNGDGNIYSYTWGWGSHSVINDFDIATDQVDLGSFWTSYEAFTISNNANGDAVIDLTNLNNQTITIEGVSAEDLSADNITGVTGDYSAAVNMDSSTPPPADDEPPVNEPPSSGTSEVFSFTWNWGAHTVIDDFDVNNDIVDLKSFWTTRDQVPIYDDASGNAVIDLTNMNNQTITIEGVSSNELDSDNVVF